jgi:hypothetical protein
MNCNSLWVHQWKPWKGVHSTFQVSSWCLDPICKTILLDFCECVLIIVDWINSPSRIGILYP